MNGGPAKAAAPRTLLTMARSWPASLKPALALDCTQVFRLQILACSWAPQMDDRLFMSESYVYQSSAQQEREDKGGDGLAWFVRSPA